MQIWSVGFFWGGMVIRGFNNEERINMFLCKKTSKCDICTCALYCIVCIFFVVMALPEVCWKNY